jgi:hypothetical protein
MLAVVRGIAFALLAALVVWRLVRAGRTGEISSRGFTFAYASSPIWFLFGVISFVLIFIFCVCEVAFAAGLAQDPIVLLKAIFRG